MRIMDRDSPGEQKSAPTMPSMFFQFLACACALQTRLRDILAATLNSHHAKDGLCSISITKQRCRPVGQDRGRFAPPVFLETASPSLADTFSELSTHGRDGVPAPLRFGLWDFFCADSVIAPSIGPSHLALAETVHPVLKMARTAARMVVSGVFGELRAYAWTTAHS
jgi:hypothetical protein